MARTKQTARKVSPPARAQPAAASADAAADPRDAIALQGLQFISTLKGHITYEVHVARRCAVGTPLMIVVNPDKGIASLMPRWNMPFLPRWNQSLLLIVRYGADDKPVYTYMLLPHPVAANA